MFFFFFKTAIVLEISMSAVKKQSSLLPFGSFVGLRGFFGNDLTYHRKL